MNVEPSLCLEEKLLENRYLADVGRASGVRTRNAVAAAAARESRPGGAAMRRTTAKSRIPWTAASNAAPTASS
ncbi:hypothetical protein ACFIOY_19310 [Bradyrhizobium sp. TZ2]